MLQKRGMGSVQQTQGTGKQWENEKWEENRELEMNLLIGSGFQLDFLPIKIHINRHHDRLLTWRTKSNGSLPGNLAPRVLISLLAYENNSTLQRLSFQSEIKLQMHHVNKVNPRTYKGGEGVGAIPSKVFLSFFLKDKRRIGRGVAYMFFSVHLWKIVEIAKKLLIISLLSSKESIVVANENCFKSLLSPLSSL